MRTEDAFWKASKPGSAPATAPNLGIAMTDETEELPSIYVDQDSRSEVYEWSAPNGDGGTIIFPRGVEQWADDNEVSLVRINSKTGAVEYLSAIGSKWTDVTKSAKSSLRSVEAAADG